MSNAASTPDARVTSAEIAVSLTPSAARAVVASAAIAVALVPSAARASTASAATAVDMSVATAVCARKSVKYRLAAPSVKSSVSTEPTKCDTVIFARVSVPAT